MKTGAMYLVSYFCPYFSNDPSAKLFCRITLSSDILSKRFRALAPDKTVGLFVKSDAYVLAVPGVEGARALMPLRNCRRDHGAFCQMEAMSIWPSPFNPLTPRCAIFSPRRCLL